MQFHFCPTITNLSPSRWDALFWAHAEYPFTKHAFLANLETSGCTTKESGWAPHHLLVTNSDDELIAALVLYSKTHSYGEYVFDWAWADAYAHHGLNYYPKLLSAIPFTPATGPRIGFARALSNAEKTDIIGGITQYLQDFAQAKHYSSAHILFPHAEQLHLLTKASNEFTKGGQADGDADHWLMRIGVQYQWFNHNYPNFDAFLATFSSRKRKNVKKERAKAQQHNIEITMRPAEEIPEAQWQQFYELYHHTYLKRSGRYGYLNKSFFLTLAKHFPQQVLLCQAWREGAMVAAALYLRDEHTLYGRYWGAMEEFDGLHFEACYYQGIEYAIEHKLQRFDPGAQGEHKIQRGFVPVKTSSVHWLAHPGFQQGVKEFVQREEEHMEEYIADARALLPFREEITLPDKGVLI